MEALRKILRELVIKHHGPYDQDLIGTELGGLVSKLSVKYPPKILVRVSAEIAKWDRKKSANVVNDIYYMKEPIDATEAVEILRDADRMLLY